MVSIERGLTWPAVFFVAFAWLLTGAGLAQESRVKRTNSQQSQPSSRSPAQTQTPRQTQPARPLTNEQARQPGEQRMAAAPLAGPRTNRLRNLPGLPKPLRPREPWVLTGQQEAELDLVLRDWEKKSGEVKTLTCDFTLLEFDTINTPPGKPPIQRESRGELKFAYPDKGVFHVTKEKVGDDFVASHGDHWVCDGRALYEYDHKNKKLTERILPDELKGQAIANGPLPFFFGQTAERMRQRYWLKVSTPREEIGQKIWLDAVPKFQEDRANYERASIILTESDMLPYALQITLPNGDRKVYVFSNFSINNLWKKIFRQFDPPRVPNDWEHVIEQPPPPPGRVDRQLVPPNELQSRGRVGKGKG